jgi:hypothetical protein
MIMSNLNLTEQKETDSADELEQKQVSEQDHVELFGREFRIVQNGLDPEEVIDYLQNVNGSSDATFKQLEQFSAIHAVAKTMEESIAQARRLAENARAQAEVETRQEKERVIEDTKRQAAETIERVTETCLTSLDTVYSALLETIKDAFDKTRETAARILTEIGENAQAEVVAQLGQSLPDIKQPEEGASVTEAGDSEVVTAEEKEATQLNKDGGPDLTGLYESWEKLRDSERLLEATIRDNSASIEDEQPADNKAALQSNVENDSQVDAGSPPQGEVEQESASHADDTQDDEEQGPTAVMTLPDSDEAKDTGARTLPDSDEAKDTGARTAGSESGQKVSDLYSGNVTLLLPEGVPSSWRLHLRQRILETPGAQILWEAYSYEDGENLNLLLSEPLALPDMLRELPDVIRVTDKSNNGSNKRKKLKWLSGKQQQQQILAIELGSNAIGQL